MTHIDIIMARLHETSLPVAVGSLDGAALAAEAQARIAMTRRTGTAAAVAAMVLGVAGSAFPAAAVEASIATPLELISPFAPSTLLAD